MRAPITHVDRENHSTEDGAMLGEKFSDLSEKIIGTRVIAGPAGPRVEVSFQGTSKTFGIDMNDLGTYTSEMQPSGFMHAEGQGISMTKDGETVTWRGMGVGKPAGKGMASSYRFSVTYKTTSTKLARLNGLVGVGEWEADEHGNVHAHTWEWK
jgi:hypothetical protein